MSVFNGCDRLLRESELLRGRRYGLLAHSASVSADFRPLHLALATLAPEAKPAALFGPEHGYYAVEQDMVASADQRDPWTGAPIVSLYGDHEGTLVPSPDAFEGLDLLLIDLQDVGSRYYTFVATAVWAARVALEAGLDVWVLDRPNPLGGEVVEGNLRGEGYDSFVGAFPHPVRHGLTLAEIVLLEAGREGWARRPEIFKMEGWNRAMVWKDLDRPWIAPSPNMPTPETAVVYPGGCLIEATAFSEGRGTTRPFQWLGDPHLSDPPALAEQLNQSGIPGWRCLPIYFRPQFQKCAGEVCGGVEIVVVDPEVFPAYRAGIEVLAAFREALGEHFAWRDAPYEFVRDRPAIDLLTGDRRFREALEEGVDRVQLDAWLDTWKEDEKAFREERADVLLY